MSETFTGKVSKLTFNKENPGKSGVWYYYKINFEGDSKTYSIGFNVKDPEYAKVGSTIQYENTGFFDGSIRMLNPKSETKTTTSTYVDNSVGAMVGNAINNAVNLAIAGIITFDNLETAARGICEMSNKLKQEFSNNKN